MHRYEAIDDALAFSILAEHIRISPSFSRKSRGSCGRRKRRVPHEAGTGKGWRDPARPGLEDERRDRE
uniref:hypothetical protein n=1 Tax=Methanoculleus caldifontis TaxID=2651577 RepID=UPI0029371496|nr:hypothetical protein [Methanoculleus sp. Wushi-C6]